MQGVQEKWRSYLRQKAETGGDISAKIVILALRIKNEHPVTGVHHLSMCDNLHVLPQGSTGFFYQPVEKDRI